MGADTRLPSLMALCSPDVLLQAPGAGGPVPARTGGGHIPAGAAEAGEDVQPAFQAPMCSSPQRQLSAPSGHALCWPGPSFALQWARVRLSQSMVEPQALPISSGL